MAIFTPVSSLEAHLKNEKLNDNTLSKFLRTSEIKTLNAVSKNMHGLFQARLKEKEETHQFCLSLCYG